MGEQRGECAQAKAVSSQENLPRQNIDVPTAGADRSGDTAFVINLCSSMRPITVAETLDLSKLGDCRLCQSRRREDGRERFRLHLGLFASEADATRVVSLVRWDFPAALVMRASAEDFRSFDGIVSLSSKASSEPARQCG